MLGAQTQTGMVAEMTIEELKLSFAQDDALLRRSLLEQKLVCHDAALAAALIPAGEVVGHPKGTVLYQEGALFRGMYRIGRDADVT